MIKRKLLCTVCFLLCAVILFNPIPIHAAEAKFNWYCVRSSDHKQPLADANMRWIENYGGYYIDHAHGDASSEKVVYLTFDAGYENGNVSKILDILAQEEVSGAFFILGHLIQSHPEVVRRMANEGHLVCNHTNRHGDITKHQSQEELQAELASLETLYREQTGKELARYFRPPEGRFDQRSMEHLQALGYQTIFWSLTYADWDNERQPDPQKAKDLLLKHIHNGAVILLHPTSRTNTLILKDFIEALKRDGYRFGTLDELVQKQ